MVEGMNFERLEEGVKDRPSEYKLSTRLWGAVGLSKKKTVVKVNTRLSPYIAIHPEQHLHTWGTSGGKWV